MHAAQGSLCYNLVSHRKGVGLPGKITRSFLLLHCSHSDSHSPNCPISRSARFGSHPTQSLHPNLTLHHHHNNTTTTRCFLVFSLAFAHRRLISLAHRIGCFTYKACVQRLPGTDSTFPQCSRLRNHCLLVPALPVFPRDLFSQAQQQD